MRDDCNIQVAEFIFPFPAEIFKTEMIENGIDFKDFHKNSIEGGSGSLIFYVRNSDFDKAFILKEKIDKEYTISDENSIHPIQKCLMLISLIFLLSFLIYQLIDFFINEIPF